MQQEYNQSVKRGGFWKRFFLNIFFGLLFGIFAGVSFFTIKFMYDFIPLEQLGLENNHRTGRVYMEDAIKCVQNGMDCGTDVKISFVSEIDDGEISEEPLTVTEVVKQTMPSIVSIKLKADINYYGHVQEVNSAGSGIIVGQNDTELLLVTNFHVVEGGKEISVQFCDGEEAPATVKGQDISMDLAVMTVKLEDLSEETKDSIRIIRLGDSESLEVGETVIAIGNALGYGQSVTTGVVSALNREMTLENGETGTFIQTDAAINQGNSGGALINNRGELIGINSNKLGGTYVEGMGYAIPINAAEPIISQLMNKEELIALPEEQQSYLGISGASLDSMTAAQLAVRPPVGVYIYEVSKEGPAGKAGLQRGDVITEFEGNSIANMEELKEYLAAYPAGTTVTLTYERLEGEEYVEHQCQVYLENKIS